MRPDPANITRHVAEISTGKYLRCNQVLLLSPLSPPPSALPTLWKPDEETKLMATSPAKLTFRVVVAMVVIVVLFYVGRPLYWKISATVHDIRHNKQTVREGILPSPFLLYTYSCMCIYPWLYYSIFFCHFSGISQIVYEAQKSVGWYHDESDSGIRDDRAKKAVATAARRLLLVKVVWEFFVAFDF